ncbi:FAD-dependent oxidoreductase [Pseudomonas silesiensis]|uniref:FAD-dependent oxidoreductase n=1 Tax=Pseudomonas silesiensis TaxID=1853130 RepID=UPI0034D6B389
MAETQAIIVGAGPTGIITALGLARSGIDVTVLERAPGIVDSPRAMVYHWSVLAGLDELGILQDAQKLGFKKQDYCYLVYRTGERIEWNLKDLVAHTPFAYNLHLGQNKLAEVALSHLLQLPNAQVHWNTQVTGLAQDEYGVTVTAEQNGQPRVFTADRVIGSDGARSRVRELLGQPFEGTTWPERFVATNIRYDFEQHGYARSTLMIDSQFGAIIAKIDESGLWRCTYCESSDLPEEQVLERMPAFFKEILPGVTNYELVQYSPYRMHQRAAKQFRVGRVVLAGDAAHATNPTGGLGLTSGLFDAYALYPTLTAVMRGEADDSVLDQWAEERKQTFLQIASPQASENKRLIFHSSDPVRLDQDLQTLRRLSSDKAFRMERLLFSRRLATAPIVPHHYFQGVSQ